MDIETLQAMLAEVPEGREAFFEADVTIRCQLSLDCTGGSRRIGVMLFLQESGDVLYSASVEKDVSVKQAPATYTQTSQPLTLADLEQLTSIEQTSGWMSTGS